MKTIRATLLATLLMLWASVAGYTQSTPEFSVSFNSSTSQFEVTHNGILGTDLYLSYRLVGLSAWNPIHFKGNSSSTSLKFTAGKNNEKKTVSVTEYLDNTSYGMAWLYMTGGNTRQYKFELIDYHGDVLASCVRTLTFSSNYTVSSAAFNEKYIMVNSDENGITVTDGNYSQAYHEVSLDNYFVGAVSRGWLEHIKAELRMTLSFQAKEKDDGYQHLQILVNQTDNHDEGSGDDNPGTMNYSSYMATFCHQGGKENKTYANYIFPVLAYGNCGNKGTVWGSINSTNNVGELRKQLFNTDCRASDGRLIIAGSGKLGSLNTVGIRFDASGDYGDTWYAHNVIARIQAVDNTAPGLMDGLRVSDGPYYYGSPVTISIPFKEIVIVSGGTPTITTSWGDLTYIAGSGTNVLTFEGTVNAIDVVKLSITSFNTPSGCTVKDVAGNVFNSFSTIYSNVTNKGGSAEELFNQLSDGSYEIANVEDLKRLSSYVNAGNKCDGLTFRQTADIVNVGFFDPIGYDYDGYQDICFYGNYDGGGHIISGANIAKGTTSFNVGLFGKTSSKSKMENILLSNSSISGHYCVGAIVGSNSGTVRNCLVDQSNSISVNSANSENIGGVVGLNFGLIEGCVNKITINTLGSQTTGGGMGGVVGDNKLGGQVKNCLYLGNSFTAVLSGAIAGYSPTTNNDETKNGILLNNYYTASWHGVGSTGSSDGNGVQNTDINNARRARTIKAGSDVTITPADAVTHYNVSGITAYGTKALSFSGNLYSGASQTVKLTLSHADRLGFDFQGYSVNSGSLSGNDNPYSLTVANNDITISATWNENTTIDLIAHEAVAEGQTRYWTTFFHPEFNYQLPAGALAFTMKSDKTLYCVGAGSIIPSGCAVVIMTDASALTNITSGSGTLTLTKTSETVTPESDNILSGKSSATAVSDVVTGSQKVYVLGKKSSSFGFFEFSGSTIPSNKAYYVE